jgi:hypothetical protein
VAVEKLALSKKKRNLGDRKCPGDWEKSFVELPDAIQFLQIPSERVFQQPQDFATSIRIDVSGPVNLQSFVSDSPSYQELNNSSATRVGFRIASSTIDLLHRAPIMIEPGEALLVPKRERQAVTGI